MRKKIHSGEMNVHLETFIFIIGRGKKKKNPLISKELEKVVKKNRETKI